MYCEYQEPIWTIAAFCDWNRLLASGYCWMPRASGWMIPSRCMLRMMSMACVITGESHDSWPLMAFS